jgi:hypothetical protein
MLDRNNRVLIRKGARELSNEEVERVKGSGGPGTQTACTFPGRTISAVDGDPGECPP